MAEFRELIKNFERIRDYMRDFFVYGFKVRSDYTDKSSRTYDNERRRIESWLGEYMQTIQTEKGKAVSLSVNSTTIFENPLYNAWKAKSFTDNDIMLHFYFLELLQDNKECSADELTELISENYGIVFDVQIVRLKLKEYEKEGVMQSQKEGKKLLYSLQPYKQFEQEDSWNNLIRAAGFFQEAAPLGVIGSTLLDREKKQNQCFSFKHHFLMHTLEDGILLDVLLAIRSQLEISFTNKSSKSKTEHISAGVPLKILTSTQTGRRYLCLYDKKRKRFYNRRLDHMSGIKFGSPVSGYNEYAEKLEKHLPKCWGVTFGGRHGIEELRMMLYINTEKEPYVLERLYREGRGGEIKQTGKHIYEYSSQFYDVNEMLPWIKTFTGRIVEISSDNHYAMQKLKYDFQRLYEMYCIEENTEGGNGHGTVS